MKKMKQAYLALINRLLETLPVAQDVVTDIPGLRLIRRDQPVRDESCIYRPMIEFIAQGVRQSAIGDQRMEYGAGQFMVAGIDTPCIISDVKICPEEPFLCLDLELDLALIAQMTSTLVPCGEPLNGKHDGLCLTDATPAMIDVLLRLIGLLGRPQDIAALAPLFIQELHYYLLTCPVGLYLRDLATEGSHSQRISQSVNWLRANFLEPIEIQQLAEQASMSVSTFHRHFRKVTSFSPLQYQKRLRLYEAQRLMLVENKDATTTAFNVGYESTSQFNREYKREFGYPPLKDVARMRQSGIVLS